MPKLGGVPRFARACVRGRSRSRIVKSIKQKTGKYLKHDKKQRRNTFGQYSASTRFCLLLHTFLFFIVKNWPFLSHYWLNGFGII